MNNEFRGKVALITGAASGIGAAVVDLLSAQGARVVVADIDLAAAQLKAAALCQLGGEAVAIRMDVADPASCEAAVAEAARHFGALHLAVNNAGISGVAQPVADYPLDGWRRMIEINLGGVFYSMKYEIPALLAAGGGAIVNIASIMGVVGIHHSAAYVAAKHGVIGLTKTAALDYAQHGIRVNAVAPGFIDTPMLGAARHDVLDGIAARHPVGRLGRAEEIAELTAFLLSERASFITGGVHLADGGYTAQ